MLPSFASMREMNVPPTLRSDVARGVCQSGEALFHSLMCSGAVHMSQTVSAGAKTVASTVMEVLSGIDEQFIRQFITEFSGFLWR